MRKWICAFFLPLFTWISLSERAFLAAAQCDSKLVQRIQQREEFVDSKYLKEIQAARLAALDIYDHGMLGNSASEINHKIARPPGVTVAVAVDGKLVWATGIGLADLEQCVPAIPKTRFRIGSTSKPLTAVGALLLYEQGRLDLDAPIQRYVPSFPEKGGVPTTRQLLGHLGGIRGYTAADGNLENQNPYHSVTESLKRFENDPLIAPPGSKWHYSSYGYVLVSAAMEGASGQDFLSLMHDSVFVPLGMQDTTADKNDDIIPNRARWYNLRSDGTYRNSPYADLSYKWAAGGFLSTAEDLALFGSALLKPGFLKQATLTMMFTPQRTSTGETTKYGLGWEIHEPGDQEPELRFGHSGGATGSGSFLIIYPKRKAVLAWLQNSDDFRDPDFSRIVAPFFRSQAPVDPKSAANIVDR
jgi:serine beta-lactamase-like protein LACTB, mitochondrial